MVKRLTYLMVWLAWSYATSSWGQQLTKDINLHMSQVHYFVGDVMKYSIHLNPTKYRDSVCIYSSLYSVSGVELMHQKLRTNNHSIGGQFEIPYDTKEGTYTLVCFVVWDHDTQVAPIVEYTYKYIPILNDLADAPENAQTEEEPVGFNSNNHQSALFMKQDTNGNIFLKHESLGVDFQKGNYSVSITPYLSASILPPSDSIKFTSLPLPASYKIRTRLKLEGILTDPISHKPVTEKYLSLFFPQTGTFKRLASTNGAIDEFIPSFDWNFEFQILSLNPNHRYPLSFKEKNYDTHFMSVITSAPAFIRTPAIQYLLRQHIKKRIINDLYDKVQNRIVTATDTFKEYHADKTYKITDFQDIKSLEEFIREVLLDCHLTEVLNGKKSLRMRSRENKNLFRWPAWYLVDGYFTGDESTLLEYDISKIKSISLYNKQTTITSQFDDMMKYSGVFQIKTYIDDNPHKGVYKYTGWSVPQHVVEKKPTSKQGPDLNQTLWWDLSYKGTAQNTKAIVFSMNDLPGYYVVSIQGFEENGVMVERRVIVYLQ